MIGLIRDHVIPAAYAVLPAGMASTEATAMLVAMGFQESRFLHRKQLGGPARGFWQFEQSGGVIGVLGHSQTAAPAREALRALCYPSTSTPFAVYDALAHNDVLAAVFARLLLWTLPDALPKADESTVGYGQYLRAWRPGKPKPDTWPEAWTTAWAGATWSNGKSS